jgi:hypothetical protein
MGYLELAHSTQTRVSARTALSWLLPLVVGAAAVVWQLQRGANADVSWLLTVAERLADGRRDFVEINPPGAVFTYLPAVWVARLSGLSAEAACDLLVAAVAALSLGLASLALGPRFAARHDAPPLVTVAVVILLVLPGYAFGQREHLGVMLLLPWIAVLAARVSGTSPSLWLQVCAGVAGGLSIVVKPHFALDIAALCSIAIWHRRSWRSLFCAENLAAATVTAVYAAVLWLWFADYFVDTAPMVAAVYVPDRLELKAFLLAPVTILWACALRLTSIAGGFRRALPAILLALSTVSYFLFLLQGKGWAYQSYPAVSFALLALTVQLASADGAAAMWPAIGRLAAGLAAFVMFVIAALWFDTAVLRDTRAIAATIEKIAPSPGIAAISADISIGFPVTRMVHGHWAQRSASLLMAAGVRRRRLNGDLPAAALAKIEPYEILDRDRLRDDIRANRPDILLVEDKSSEPFDWLGWARSDAQFAAALDDYAFVRQIDDVQIWRRK